MPFTKIELSPEVFATVEKMARVMAKGDVEFFLSEFITGAMESMEKVIDLNVNDLKIRFPSDSDQ